MTGTKNNSYASFTLIELLIVVAIIAILALIAVPNFLEAQTRAKVSRVKADMRSLTTAIEAYAVDYHRYPPGYRTVPRYGLYALTSPVAYFTTASILDPFKPPGLPPEKSSLTYELMNVEGKTIEKPAGPYSVDPDNPAGQPTRGVWWWLASRGPDRQFGFRPSEPEYDLRQRLYLAPEHPEGLLATIYDPTNGTVSQGNLYRAGGQVDGTRAHWLNP